MSDFAMNTAIDRLLTDDELVRAVRATGEAALAGFELTPLEAQAIVGALEGVDEESVATRAAALRSLARFQPLFAAASASSTKVG